MRHEREGRAAPYMFSRNESDNQIVLKKHNAGMLQTMASGQIRPAHCVQTSTFLSPFTFLLPVRESHRATQTSDL